jgi:hypothetical protein
LCMSGVWVCPGGEHLAPTLLVTEARCQPAPGVIRGGVWWTP